MQSTSFKRRFLPVFVLAACCISLPSFKSDFGLDSYEIYLNKTLVMKQAVDKPVNLRKLALERARDGDLLRIYYRHCHEPRIGTNRSIALMDDTGAVVKKWSFANATGGDGVMVIEVKELLQLSQNRSLNDLSLHYTSRELPEMETLALIRFR